MTIQTFIEKYYLHESLITKITHNETSVNFEVEFCYWQQENYKEGSPEIGTIEISFSDISLYDSDGLSGEIDYFSILDAEIDNDILNINILDDFNDEYYTISIKADKVAVKKI